MQSDLHAHLYRSMTNYANDGLVGHFKDTTPAPIISATLSIPAFPTILARKTQLCGYFKRKRCSKHIKLLPRSKAFGW